MNFNINKNLKKKAISPLISTILLVLIAAILVATFSSWSKLFVQEKIKDTSQNITTASDFECSRSNLDVESCTINAVTKDITLLVHNPSTINYQGITLNIQARDDVDNNTFKLLGRFTNNLEPGQSILLKTEEDFSYIKEEKAISELRLENIDLMTLTTLTCPDKSIDISNCEEIDPLVKSCPDGYVLVPGNSEIYGTDDFCVMQFEAKVDNTGDGIGDSNSSCEYISYNVWDNHKSSCSYTESGRSIVSTIEGYPLTYLTQPEAKIACESIGEGYHLITNEEWMTIARNIEAQSENWSTGTIGSGYIPRGNSDSLAALDDTTVLSGINKRDLVLSNGNKIYDLAGNVWEWVDKTITRGDMPPLSIAWVEYTDVIDYGIERRSSYNFEEGKDYNSSNSIGKIYCFYHGGSSDEKLFLRGGDWTYETCTGLLSLSLYNGSVTSHYRYGFRCSVEP